MASYLGLNKLSYQMVEGWGIVHKCSTPVGAPGCVTQKNIEIEISIFLYLFLPSVAKTWLQTLSDWLWEL